MLPMEPADHVVDNVAKIFELVNIEDTESEVKLRKHKTPTRLQLAPLITSKTTDFIAFTKELLIENILFEQRLFQS